jgi:glycosyltransferase involved in cell wall biosynthesis
MSVLNLRPRKLGSFEEYTISLSRALTQQGGQSILVFKDAPPEALRPHYTDAGALLEIKPFEPFSRESARALTGLIRKHRPHVVHLHFVNMLSLDVVAASLHRGVKVVFSEHASDIPKERAAWRWRLLQGSKRIFSSGIDRVIAPSNYVNTRLVSQGVNARKVITVYNGVNVESFRNASGTEDFRAKYGIGPNSVIVASISQLIPEKGIGYLIDAAALALKEGRHVSFIHVGDGPCATEYRDKVRHLGIEKHFIFAGLLNMWEIGGILRQSDIFTLPCTWGEAFSLVILEALAAGKPAIVTRAGGNTEAVEDGRNGLAVTPHDARALADAIISLHDSPERRLAMGMESAKRSGRFTVDRWVGETLDIYARLAKRDFTRFGL